jgi:hypothetical protein
MTIDISETKEHEENDSSREAVFSAAKLSSLFTIITILNLLSRGLGECGGGPVCRDASGAKFFWMTLVAMGVILLIFALR